VVFFGKFDADQFIESRTSYPELTRAINIPPNIQIARWDPGFPRPGFPLLREQIADLGSAFARLKKSSPAGSRLREWPRDTSFGGVCKTPEDFLSQL
jgi:hypothetical protein